MRLSLAALLLTLAPVHAQASVACGGSFGDFVTKMKAEAVQRGHDRATVDRFFASARQDPNVIRADRAQGIFQRPFTDFSRRLISQGRIDNGRRNAERWGSVFDRIEATWGVPREVILAFWAFETDYGAVQGDFNTVNALLTLSHDCRRPDLFRPQVFSAIELFENGDIDPASTTGAWAGEIGMVQMLPGDILENGVDGDGDGHVYLKTSAPDALMSGGKMLSSLGWRPNEPWLQEIVLPAEFDWAATGIDKKRTVADWAGAGVRARTGSLAAANLPASIVLPQGRNGPAFIAYPNFDVYFEWNQSFVYVLTAAYFASRLDGAPVFDARNPTPPLSQDQMKELQRKLAARGHDVGGVDGILGAGTRAAVQAEQARLGMPPDAWPTVELLSAL
ncbi:MAG: lytic murein transglycosylase [Pseudomonadota bacterium]